MKMKIFAVVMAVMCVMSCMCLTAFAAESDLPPDTTLVTNGQTINSNDWNMNYAISANNVETITITGLFGFSRIHGWNGTQWVNITNLVGAVADSVTFSPADYPEYTYFTVTKGDTMAQQDFTVTWTTPSIFDNMSDISSAMWSSAKDAVGFVMKAPLAQITVIIGIVLLGCLLAKRYLFAQ